MAETRKKHTRRKGQKKRRSQKKKGILGKIFFRLKKFFKKWTRRGKILLLMLSAAILLVVAKDFIESRYSNKKNRSTINSEIYNGIDVSKFQGKIDWETVAQDEKIQFAYIKASEGATRYDKNYKTNTKNARKAGIKVGSYHYFIGRTSAKEQFINFKKNVKKNEQDLIPVVDVEEKGNSKVNKKLLRQNLKEFLELIKDEYGRYPILYSQYSFYNTYLAPEFNKYCIFIARYSNQKPTLKGEGKYSIWQFSEKGKIKGIKGNVDLDRFMNETTISDIEL